MNKRDDFSQKTIDTLCERVGGKCSNPNCRRKTKGDRELIADINKRFKVFCTESYDLEGIGCMNCELNFEDEESCEIQYIKMLLGKDE